MRYQVVGTGESGKSTFAEKLAVATQWPHIVSVRQTILAIIKLLRLDVIASVAANS